MRAISLMLTILMLAGGCMTIQHPASPGIQYASKDSCQQYNLDTPSACQKVLHQQATAAAVDIGTTILIVLGYFAVIALLIAGAR